MEMIKMAIRTVLFLLLACSLAARAQQSGTANFALAANGGARVEASNKPVIKYALSADDFVQLKLGKVQELDSTGRPVNGHLIADLSLATAVVATSKHPRNRPNDLRHRGLCSLRPIKVLLRHAWHA